MTSFSRPQISFYLAVRDAVNRERALAALKAVQLDGGPGRCLLGEPQA
jgi:hypothetical protein